MSIQILQYEFLGPVPLADWGPPMSKIVYLILRSKKDTFSILYADECAHTDDKAYFVQHERFKCWVENAGSENFLHLAILPLFDASDERRASILQKIVDHYMPPCNTRKDTKPDYKIRT